MKRIIVGLAVLLVSLAAFGRNASLSQVASWTPPRFASVAADGWLKALDSDQATMWVAFSKLRGNNGAAQIAVKTAYKGLSGDVTGIDILSAQVLCGAGGTPPDYAHVVDVEHFAGNGAPMNDSGVVPTLALMPGTDLASVVKVACKSLGGPTAANAALQASSGKCKAPSPNYPMQAMRMGQQGVVTVGFNVGAGEHPESLSVESSSGSPALDQAALQSVAQAVCNGVPRGSHVAMPVTFSLNATR